MNAMKPMQRMKPAINAVCVILLTFVGVSGCSTLDALNPFSASAPKMASLQALPNSIPASVVWQESVGKGDGFVFYPAVVGNSVYAASRKGEIVRIDEGRVVWTIKTEQTLSGGVGANSSIVVVGGSKGDILAFKATDGQPLWSAKASSEILAPPAVDQGLVLVRSGDNRLAAYDELSGQRKWIFQRPTPALSLRTSAPPLIDEKFAFVGFPAGKLIAVNLANGTPVWDGTVALPKGSTELDRVADITSLPVLLGENLCAVAYQGRVSCFDLKSGNLIWASPMSSSVGIAMDMRYLFVTDDKSAVHALDMATGATVWKQDKLSLRQVGAPVILGRYVVVADVEGIVHFLSREDGAFVGRVSTDGGAILAPLQHQNDRLIVQTAKGGIFSIGIK